MRQVGQLYVALGVIGIILLGAVAEGRVPGIWRTYRPLENDSRVVKDRLHSSKNLNSEDDSF
ncbi:MAG: hypothetical protein ACLQO1_22500, partial [Steroidobacteraceae bacterium]